MVESILHKRLVTQLQTWVTNYSVEEKIIYCDYEYSFYNKDHPPLVEGYMPDIYAISRKTKIIILGEAKTTQKDLESEHSEKQISAFLNYCSNQNNSVFVLAVPFIFVNCGKSFLSFLKRTNNISNVETHVINSFGINM